MPKIQNRFPKMLIKSRILSTLLMYFKVLSTRSQILKEIINNDLSTFWIFRNVAAHLLVTVRILAHSEMIFILFSLYINSSVLILILLYK